MSRVRSRRQPRILRLGDVLDRSPQRQIAKTTLYHDVERPARVDAELPR